MQPALHTWPDCDADVSFGLRRRRPPRPPRILVRCLRAGAGVSSEVVRAAEGIPTRCKGGDWPRDTCSVGSNDDHGPG